MNNDMLGQMEHQQMLEREQLVIANLHKKFPSLVNSELKSISISEAPVISLSEKKLEKRVAELNQQLNEANGRITNLQNTLKLYQNKE